MNLAGGALREGLIYSMLNQPVEKDIRQNTIQAIQEQYAIDQQQADRVSQLIRYFCSQLKDSWDINDNMTELLHWAGQVHEIGLSIDFKQSPQHAAYLLNHTEMPGFTPAQRKLLAALLINQTDIINLPVLAEQNALSLQQAQRLVRLLRIAILLCRSRHSDRIPDISLIPQGEQLNLEINQEWLSLYPLQAEALQQESRWQTYSHLPLIITPM